MVISLSFYTYLVYRAGLGALCFVAYSSPKKQEYVTITAPHRRIRNMETIFQILGIVYYTVALARLLAEIRKEQREKERD